MKNSERTDWGKSDEHTQRERIEALKEEARALSEGKLTSFVSPHCSPEVEEAFWEHVVSFERRAQGRAETSSRSVAEELAESSIHLPPHEQLADGPLKEKLSEVIQGSRRSAILSVQHRSS